MRNFISLFLFLLSINPAKTQQYVIKGFIYDSIRKPIQNAHVESFKYKTGQVTKEDGYFKLKSITGDSIKISCIGFESRFIICDSITIDETLKVYLKPIEYQLPVINVNPAKGVEYRIEDKIKGKTSISGFQEQFGFSLARKIVPNEGYINNYLKEIEFYIKKDKGVVATPLRLRILRVKEDGSPGEDLVNHYMIIQPKKKWNTVKIEKPWNNLVLPEEGFYISLEYYENLPNKDNSTTYFGNIWGCVFLKESNTWYNKFGYDWQRINMLVNDSYFNLLINVKMQGEKNTTSD